LSKSSGIFLTGSTGLLGQYLLQDLLLALREVTVLVRDAGNLNAKERVAQLIAHCSERIGHKLPNPTVVVGDLNQKNLGLTSTDKQWLGKHCKTIVLQAFHFIKLMQASHGKQMLMEQETYWIFRYN